MKSKSMSGLVFLLMLFMLSMSVVSAAGGSSIGESSVGYQPTNQVSLPGMPTLGKWMIAPQGTIAHWLGYKYQGKELQEPINVILIDGIAKSQEEAKARLLSSCASAGYDNMLGHSTGYAGFIGTKLYGQFPGDENRAFSNTFFWVANNHGRVFGPHFFAGKYYFIAAFSRERLDMNTEVKHVYESFRVARDDFAQNLSERSDYQLIGKVDMGNGVPNDSATQTVGDHDGKAVVLAVPAIAQTAPQK
ncbi:MAG TPA: hypothetical protein VN631_02125 [Negativicutes bacterium]|nr:hypothetical protein [Negativicutes bacterium]